MMEKNNCEGCGKLTYIHSEKRFCPPCKRFNKRGFFEMPPLVEIKNEVE